MSDIWSYEGKRAVVTGSSSGMGAAVAATLQGLGAEVVGLDVNEPADHALAQFVPVDLRSPEAIRGAAEAVSGPIDALFNCAGVSAGAGLPAEDVFTINFTGMRELTEALLPKFADDGAICFVSSLAALNYAENRTRAENILKLDWNGVDEYVSAHPDEIKISSVYPFAKECVIWYSKHLLPRLVPQRIRTNCIVPGTTSTPFLDGTMAREETRRSVESFPYVFGRQATAQEQANVMVFLNSSAASYVNGQLIWTDGGYRTGVEVGAIAPAMGEDRAR